MSLLIPYSDIHLPIEAVPAVKLTHFMGEALSGNVYAYAKLYSLSGALVCELSRFEEKPCEYVRMGIALGNADIPDKLLFYSVAFNGNASLSLYSGGALIRELAASTPSFASGADEQGQYVNASFTISADTLHEQFNAVLSPKSVWACNVYSYDTRQAAFGSAFAAELSKGIYSSDSLTTFMPI